MIFSHIKLVQILYYYILSFKQSDFRGHAIKKDEK